MINRNRPLLIRGGHVIDPATNIDGKMDVLLSDGRVAEVAATLRTTQTRRRLSRSRQRT